MGPGLREVNLSSNMKENLLCNLAERSNRNVVKEKSNRICNIGLVINC